MIKSAIYVRSSKDRNDVACEAQEVHLREVVKGNGEAIYRVFCDKALSSTRDVRPEFDEMIGLAMSKNPPFSKIYCLDTSRFGRDQHQTQTYLWTLRKKHAIEVIFTNMPQTNSYLDPVFETIMSAFDELHSQQSKVKGVASMKQNIRMGYRAGGRAPYGYLLDSVEVAKHRNGDTITKTKLIPDPETRDIVREYFERRAKLENRRSILDDFYNRGIQSPEGRKRWSAGTVKSWEDNVEVYLGHTIFNRHNERVKIRGKADGYAGGKKWRPKEEWVVSENTHEPLITQEVADRIHEIKQRGVRQSPFNRKVYPLSGVLKCGLCGTNYAGDRGIYRCNSKTKAGASCPNNDISQQTVEDAVFIFLTEHVLDIQNLKMFAERVKSRFKKGPSDIEALEKNFDNIDRQIRKVMKLYRLGTIDDAEIETELVPLQQQKKALADRIEHEKASGGVYDISDGEIMEVLINLEKEVKHADPKIRKRVIQTLFQEARIFPKEGAPWERILEVKGVQVPLTRVNVASPRGFEPLSPA